MLKRIANELFYPAQKTLELAKEWRNLAFFYGNNSHKELVQAIERIKAFDKAIDIASTPSQKL